MKSEDVVKLHESCGVYTNPKLARRVLDVCGWTSKAILGTSRLLEPAAGDGVFLAEAADRLLCSFAKSQGQFSLQALEDRILSFELVATEVRKARQRVDAVLKKHGLPKALRTKLASKWIRQGDFLLKDHASKFTHVVGNPPYVRWSRVPPSLRARYERNLPKSICKGDLVLPFLQKSLQAMSREGRLAFVCSDRWRYMRYGDAFKRSIEGRYRISHRRIRHRPPFARRVDAYVDLLQIEFQRLPCTTVIQGNRPSSARKKSLAEFGCQVRVGPALGYEKAFVGLPKELKVESHLLAPFVRASDLSEGRIRSSDLCVVAMHTAEGHLRVLEDYPLLQKWMKKHQTQLAARSCVKHGAPWHRPIDRVRAEDWRSMKILLPEIAKVPRVALDNAGRVPSHGIYAILGPADAVAEVYSKLKHGGLARALDGIAPTVKGNYVRCYKRFLEMIRI